MSARGVPHRLDYSTNIFGELMSTEIWFWSHDIDSKSWFLLYSRGHFMLQFLFYTFLLLVRVRVIASPNVFACVLVTVSDFHNSWRCEAVEPSSQTGGLTELIHLFGLALSAAIVDLPSSGCFTGYLSRSPDKKKEPKDVSTTKLNFVLD